MARLTNNEKKKKEKIINKYFDILNLLKYSGGSLYADDIEYFLNIKKTTLRYQLNKIAETKLIEYTNVPYQATTRNVARLTQSGWRALSVDRDLSSLQDKRIEECFLNAHIHMNLLKNPEKLLTRDFIRDIGKHSQEERFNQIKTKNENYVDLSKFNKNFKRNFIVIDYNLDDFIKPTVDVIFKKNNPQGEELAEFCDFLLGVTEKYFSIKNKNFSKDPFKLKINLYVVSFHKLDKSSFNKLINNKKRKYSYYNHKSKNSMYTARQVHFKQIKFLYLDRKSLEFMKY